MDLKELFALYFGQKRLNRFRQDHGYKEGSYRKLGAGREDNEHLIEILESFSVEPEEMFDMLYQQLEQRYSQKGLISLEYLFENVQGLVIETTENHFLGVDRLPVGTDSTAIWWPS
ncbi:MAG: hypothetical protein Ct9H90mP27_6230 [Gammaproteobacteria bacterium]|nr:MAG: hypothetical protein Ct9H90mP27_6230 [Gammaproteobacteria bacterium]